jgi:hypothetical protein
MQLRSIILPGLVGAIVAMLCSTANAQSLQPMKKDGSTPSDIKGFQLIAGNPYKQRMTFIAMVMDPTFTNEVPGAVIQPAEFRLAPGASRPLILRFKIDPASKERTIAVCILPKNLESSILPRVCGTYTGRMAGHGG